MYIVHFQVLFIPSPMVNMQLLNANECNFMTSSHMLDHGFETKSTQKSTHFLVHQNMRYRPWQGRWKNAIVFNYSRDGIQAKHVGGSKFRELLLIIVIRSCHTCPLGTLSIMLLQHCSAKL